MLQQHGIFAPRRCGPRSRGGSAVMASKAGDEEVVPEDPVKRETSMTAAVLLKRSLVDRQMVDAEKTIDDYARRNGEFKGQIARRRNAQVQRQSDIHRQYMEKLAVHDEAKRQRQKAAQKAWLQRRRCPILMFQGLRCYY